MLKYGLKIWSTNKNWFTEAVNLFKQGKVGFGELYIVPNSFELKELAVLRQMPFFVHSPHYTHGFHLFDLTEEKVKLFKEQVLRTAEFLQSIFIILHPGIGESTEVFQENSAKIFDARILIENMPKLGFVGLGGNKLGEGVLCFGYSLEQLRFIHQECGFNICLDFDHALASAASQKLEYKEFISSLIDTLHPFYFHISGGHQQSKEDEHLNVFEGGFDMKWVKDILLQLAKERDEASKGDIYLVFETPKKGEHLENDIKNIDYFKSL